MPHAINARIETWLAHCTDPQRDPLQGMAEAGLLHPVASYGEIARTKAALVQRTGLPGVAGIWGGRQMVARWFIAGFGNEAQRATWLNRPAAVAISEPRVGAHPKHLTTHAEQYRGGFRIAGEKAWVSNGPLADVFIVLAITAQQAGRKRYSALLVPRDTPGMTLKDMQAFRALRPSRHCTLVLDGVQVPRAALLGPEGGAYETMALPFRDVEDAVGTFTLLGAFRFLRDRMTTRDASDDAASSLGEITALTAVFADSATGVVIALDNGVLAAKAAALSGLHVLAAEILQRLRAHQARFGPADDAEMDVVLSDLDVLLSVAKGPRQARLVNLGREAGDVF